MVDIFPTKRILRWTLFIFLQKRLFRKEQNLGVYDVYEWTRKCVMIDVKCAHFLVRDY